MKKAKIRLTNNNHKELEKQWCLHTIFGDVYAPKTVAKVREDGLLYVPEWFFWKRNTSPCQMVDGFVGKVDE